MAFDDGVKTVSGSVAHTDDAATKVPFVSVKCGIEPTLTGVTEIDVVRPDGNILQTDATSKTQNGITWTVNADGSVTLEGTSTARTYLYVHLYHKILPKDATLTVSVEGLYDNGASDVFLNLPYSDNGTTYSGTYGQVTWGSPKKTINYTADKYLGFLLDCPANVTTNQTVKIMVTIGSDAKAFEPYQTPTQYTASLGRTIYGGSADIVKGQGTEQGYKIVIDGTNIYFSKQGNYYNSYPRPLPTLGNPWKLLQSDNISFGYNSTYSFVFLTVARAEELGLYSEEEVNAYFAQNPTTIILNLATPTDFTFTPITPTPETVGNVNNVYCNTGDTEVTYHDNAHGFAEVTVNKTGKNLFDKNAVTNNTWIVVDGTATESATGYRTSSYIPVKANTRYYVSTKSSNRSAYYDKNGNGIAYFAFSGGTSFNSLYDGYIRITIKNDIDLDTFIVNEGSEAIPYEPFGIGKTAYLHKVIYGGQADVIRGTCEPKNLLDSADASHTFTSGTNTRYAVGTIALKGGITYTFSAYQEDALTSNTRNTLVINDNGNYTYEYSTGSNYHNQSGVHSMQYTPNEDKTVTLLIWVHTPSNDVTYSEFQVEKGSSVSDFAPHFDPFTFPPISMETDEGENTLFANEGDSAITYRKAVD